MELSQQLYYLFVLAIPIACIAWTVTREEIFKEPRDFCAQKSKFSKSILARKFFYLFTCEYCFSHYVTVFLLIITKFQLLYEDWRGYLISMFALVWVANVYMSLFGFIRVGMKKEKMDADIEELKLKKEKEKMN
ncbi:hypothetical protein [Flavobacterium sp.]|uniref:hypothetical protein n=1 Tax=Flavobacterium sp. TaxID=239 RepID=UPI00286C6A31|nr:hypothetical protein [Flavobacterium sp.]